MTRVFMGAWRDRTDRVHQTVVLPHVLNPFMFVTPDGQLLTDADITDLREVAVVDPTNLDQIAAIVAGMVDDGVSPSDAIMASWVATMDRPPEPIVAGSVVRANCPCSNESKQLFMLDENGTWRSKSCEMPWYELFNIDVVHGG